MKQITILFSTLFICTSLLAQQDMAYHKFYLGISYGASFPVGNFADTDPDNLDAGFAESGRKLDVYGGYPLNERFTLTGLLRYQVYETDISNIVNDYNAQNPGVNLTAVSEDWEAYYIMVGSAYMIQVAPKLFLFPRAAIGPIFVSNPAINGVITNGGDTNNLSRSSETGIGLGFDIGIGLRKNLGKHFSLMPVFDYSGGFVSIADVEINNNNNVDVNDYRPKIRSFNLGLSLAYRFY